MEHLKHQVELKDQQQVSHITLFFSLWSTTLAKIQMAFIVTIYLFQNKMRKVWEEKVTRLEEMMELKDRQQVQIQSLLI